MRCRVPCGRPGVAGVVRCGPRRVKVRNIRRAEYPGHRRVDGEPASSEAAGGGAGADAWPRAGLQRAAGRAGPPGAVPGAKGRTGPWGRTQPPEPEGSCVARGRVRVAGRHSELSLTPEQHLALGSPSWFLVLVPSWSPSSAWKSASRPGRGVSPQPLQLTIQRALGRHPAKWGWRLSKHKRSSLH